MTPDPSLQGAVERAKRDIRLQAEAGAPEHARIMFTLGDIRTILAALPEPSTEDVAALIAEAREMADNFARTGAGRFAARVLPFLEAARAPEPSKSAESGEREGWQPIETAPRGTEILIWEPRFGVGAGLQFDNDGWGCGTFNGQVIRVYPTHWQPLPAAPKPPEKPRG